MYRDHTRVVKIGNRVIGGGNPVLLQSMCNTKTEDVAATVSQIKSLPRDSRARTRSPSPRAWRPDFPGAAREAP